MYLEAVCSTFAIANALFASIIVLVKNYFSVSHGFMTRNGNLVTYTT